jgi:hypothetical protein
MVWVGAVLGLRWAEVAGLTVGSLDLLRNSLTVTEQLGRDRQLGDPKSDAGKRQLSIPEELSTVLAAHLATRNLRGRTPVSSPSRPRRADPSTTPTGGYAHGFPPWPRPAWPAQASMT